MKETKKELNNRIDKVVEMIALHGDIDGAHHKQWLIDQTLRILLGGDGYKEWVDNFENPVINEDGDECYTLWDEGVAP